MEEKTIKELLEESAKLEKEEMAKMKIAIADKTKCMISSYKEVMADTTRMFEDFGFVDLDKTEVVKRADMFWNIAFNKVSQNREKEQTKKEQAEHKAMQPNYPMPQAGQPGMPPMTVPPIQANGKKSPCQERAERDAKIIDDQKKIIESKK